MRGKLSQHPNLAGLRLFRSQIPASETLSTRTRKRRRVSADPIAPDDVLARYVEHNGNDVPARAPSTRVTSLTYDGTPPANFARLRGCN